MALNPLLIYVHLATDGTATALPGSEPFWPLAETEPAG
jgi:hypothetical protein